MAAKDSALIMPRRVSLPRHYRQLDDDADRSHCVRLHCLSSAEKWCCRCRRLIYALGLPLNTGSPSIDGYVGFGSSVNWSFSPTLTPTSTQYYFIGVAEHEISEVMGRFSDVGTGAYSLMDLFRYDNSGNRDLTAGHGLSTANFSIDGGNTSLGTWNNVANNGDSGRLGRRH